MALICLAGGVVLSRRVEPGVRVEAVTLAGNTPALRFQPPGAGPHPVALLAHGITASKETLFRFGEALAAAGFVGLAVDLPGHGASRRAFSFTAAVRTLQGVARTNGPVEVFLGHSMGAYTGAGAVGGTGLNPKLFIAVGALPNLGRHGPPLLLLAGQFEELFPPALLKARTEARLVLSPWSDHALEPYDPRLVAAAVEAACAAVGQTPPAAPTAWRWRLAGVVLSVLGAFGLALGLPELSPRLAQVRGLLLPVLVIATLALTTSPWFGAVPRLGRSPLLTMALAVALLLVLGAGKLGLPRWIFLVPAVLSWFGCAISGLHLLAFFVAIFALILLGGTLLGRLAAHRGSRRDGDLAMALFVGYVIGQWMPRIL